ncbi:MAG: hypothetical protein GTN97_09150 [Nitrosopumilaceae archaeon]|nr:hypothetical protein [Nitrosopumilaceae archaeon]NIP09785.1 hypothetical protein [Nitrosopumilaceae archaeon]NIS96042.1 hypothetical protein [Nitrosopumilaceae archaeon]
MIRIGGIVLSLFVIVFVVDQEAFAFSNNYQEEFLDLQKYTGNRIMVFNDTKIDYCITENNENPFFNHIAANSIKTWHDRIVDVTNNPSVWDMSLHIYPKNESICDGYINFVDTPNPTVFQISGVAGFSHPLTSVANVTIYTDDYQSTLEKLADNDENFWKEMTLEKFQKIIKNENHDQLDYDKITRIILHEIGHSLSLNHPITSDGNLHKASGIMGYDMDYDKIDDSEVMQIIKAYPNGFSKVSSPHSIKLNEPTNKNSVNLGETASLTIEIPHNKGKLPPTGIELYIFPEGTFSQKTDFAPIKILKVDGVNHLVNDGEYLQDIHVSMTHWDTFTKVLSLQFKVVKEFKNADMIIVAHSMGGFEKQWFLNDVLSVEKALFSDLLLDLETTEYTYHLMSENPNRLMEKESAFKTKQKELYHEALSECLSEKNMKKCQDEIKLEDFEQKEESVPIWMPIMLLMN